MDDPINPYATPKTPLSTKRRDVDTVRKPRSLKWATFVLFVETYLRVADCWEDVEEYGLAEVVEDLTWIDLLAILAFPGCMACLLALRNKPSYYLTSMSLAAVTLGTVHDLAFYLQDYSLPVYLIVFSVLVSYMYLFYRVAFGVPARVYFGEVEQTPQHLP